MLRFLIDEDLPRSLARELRQAGFEADDVREIGMKGQPDDAVLVHAVAHGLVLVTADMGFANVLRYPLGSHPGILVARFPNEMPTSSLVDAIVKAIREVPGEEVSGSLIVIEPGRVRLRRRH